MKKYLDIYISIAAVLIIMLLSLTGNSNDSSTNNAILCVLVLILVVNLNNRKDFQDTVDDLKEHQLSYILGGMVPDVIYEHIRDYIVRNCFIRTGCFVSIKLEELNDEFMEVQFKDRYKVINLSSTSSIYQIKGIVEKEFGYEVKKNKFESLSITQRGKTQRYTGESLKKFINEKNNTITLTKNLSMKGREEIEITTRRVKIQRSIDSNYWKPPQISDGLTVNVSHPTNVTVCANAFHPTDVPLSILVDDIDEKTWAINEGLLPYQGINITWKKVTMN